MEPQPKFDIEWLQAQIGGLYAGMANLRAQLRDALEEIERLKAPKKGRKALAAP